MYEKFKGIFPALLTPFDKEGRVDCDALVKLTDYNLKKGVNGFYVGGSTAEGFMLDPDEHYKMYSAVAQGAKGKGTLIAHVGDMSLKNAVEYAKMAEKLGYDAVSSVTPFYYKYTPEQVAGYYKAIASAVSLPVIIYCIPALSGVEADKRVFEELLGSEEFIGLKFTSNDFFMLERLKNKYPDKIFYNGYDEMCLSGFAAGADGAVGSTYNLMAEKFIEIYRLVKDNNFKEALMIQHRANDVIAELVGGVDVKASLKFAVSELVGIDMGVCRPPQTDVPTEWKNRFKEKFGGEFVRYEK